MRGYTLFNFPAFDVAAERLREKGWDVISPAEMDRAAGFDETKGHLICFKMDEAIKRDLDALSRATAIALLKGWQNSTGAVVEKAIADWRKLTILDAETGEPMKPETIAEEANRLVYGAREADYGHPFDDFSRTGKMWSAILGLDAVTPEQVSLCMVALKISRECNRPKRDNRVDGVGYFATLDRCHEERGRRGL
jgi:hypothetical protein